MNDVKKGYREVKNTVKEQARKIDGESPADKVANLGDDVRDNLGNAGDDVRDNLGNVGDQMDEKLDKGQVRDEPRRA